MKHAPNRRTLGVAWLVPVLLAAAACQSNVRQSSLDQVNDLITHGEYEDAVRYSALLAEEFPDDEEAQRLHRLASVAWHLDVARTLTFDDRDEEALERLREAQRIAPDAEVIQSWIDKTYRKLATYWLDNALEMHAEEKLEAAIEAYSNSLEYEPGNLSALNGLAKAVIQVNYREGLSETYYKDGMRALTDYYLQQARSRFSYSGKYRPESERTEKRLEQVNELIADQRVVIARTLEDEQRFGAARNEYKLALGLDPENAVAEEGLERTTIEAQASQRLRDAKMSILRRDYDQARAAIEEGLELTSEQHELFEGALADIEESRLSEMYEEAVNLEKDYLYPAAIVAYTTILGEADYYRDVITRRSTLQEYVRRAEELYASSQEVDGQERLDLLQQIEIFWPEYRDVEVQLEALRNEP